MVARQPPLGLPPEASLASALPRSNLVSACSSQNAGASELLTGSHEKELALLVKDYLFLQSSFRELRAVLKRDPSQVEWAMAVKMEPE